VHEDLSGRRIDVTGGSDRSFGIVMALAFAIAGIAPLRHHLPVRMWALGVAAAIAAIALARPALLHPANRLWTGVARLLNLVTSPILMAAVYGLAIVPTGMVMRRAGRDPMRRRRRPDAASYWIGREAGGTDMRRQF